MRKFKRHATSIKSDDGFSIYYEVDYPKTHKTLLFLHGLGGDLTIWNEERKRLNSYGYATIAVDLRGHGLSDRPSRKEDYDLKHFVDDIYQVIQHEHLLKTSITGHSLGGMIALTLEGTYPKTSQSLVLVDTGYKAPAFAQKFIDHPLFHKLLEILIEHMPDVYSASHVNFAQFKGTGNFNVSRFFSDIIHTSFRDYFLICDQLISYDASGLLKKIQVPTLIIEGQQDSVFPPNMAKDLAHRIKHAYLEVIENADHILLLNNSNDVTENIHKFLQRIRY